LPVYLFVITKEYRTKQKRAQQTGQRALTH